MNELTFGDLIMIELILVEKMKTVDLGLQSGQYMVALIGKIEYQVGQIDAAAQKQQPLDPSQLG